MVQVAPSILSADFANLERDCRRVVTRDDPMLHFDVMDGVFVPNLSVGLPVLESLVKALPEAVYDVHLMILRPHLFVERFARAGADAITIHFESESPLRSTLKQIRALGLKAGVSLRPGTPVQEVYSLLEEVDLVLVMSVEPGFGGQAFLPEAPARIAALRAEAQRQGTPLLIEVDGGINAATAPLCIAAGADILVAGSAVFHTADPMAAVRQIKGD
ncbi:ribulose-phosphate 3-epimerase [Ruminococcaceae bacterium OttesenSCG-928-O06]|nr:ribulose-phosphate 3-epimerase [Ruminococcaceae bacterium OttesenSCG-928-O06]